MFIVTAAHCANKPEITNIVIGETNRETEYDCLYPGTLSIEHTDNDKQIFSPNCEIPEVETFF